jgi:hypothetical protein
MNSKTIEDRLKVLDGMNRALGKITNVQIRLTIAGETDLANKLDKQRKALIRQIEELQGRVADQWTVSAATLTEKLRAANTKVQSRILNIKKKINVANNATAIIGQIDDALKFLKNVVP